MENLSVETVLRGIKVANVKIGTSVCNGVMMSIALRLVEFCVEKLIFHQENKPISWIFLFVKQLD